MSNFKNKENNICRGNLSDDEYLKHMIPHHIVAVDISEIHKTKSKSPKIQEILRKLIWTQKYEIELMKEILKNNIDKISNYDEMNSNYIISVADFIKPNTVGLTQTYCDPNFFNPEEHIKHIKNMDLNDKMYIEHMIPHHQVAVDMSKVLIQNTNNDIMINLAYRIIRSQQEEILILQRYLESPYKHNSELLY
tara:strand:+ start:932 stop:1510 length:579 start_codon:yes stop_codon:yes gene_type:complete